MNCCAVATETSSDEAGSQTINESATTSSSQLSIGHCEPYDNHCFLPDTSSPDETFNEKRAPSSSTEYITDLKLLHAGLAGEFSKEELLLKPVPAAALTGDGAGHSALSSVPILEVPKDKRKRPRKGSVLCCVLL